MKFPSFALVSAFLLVMQGCSTVGVPGEGKVVLRNIATEYYSIAEGYFGMKNYSKAAEYYERAMKDESLRVASFYKMARSYAMAQNWEKAAPCYDELLSQDPDNLNLKVSVAYIAAMRGDTDSALSQFKSLCEENPYEEQVLENYVALLLFVGRAEDAEVGYRKLKATFPENSKLKDFSQQLSELADNFSDGDADGSVKKSAPPLKK